MALARALFLFACCALVVPSQAQDPKAPAKSDKKDAKPGKQEKELAPGYRTTKIEGFTFLIEEAVFTQDVSKYERKPLDVLELECKRLVKVLSPKSVEALRNLIVWAEWDDKVPVANGREGFALARYYSGSAELMVKENKHPLRSKTVTIHLLKSLTESRQPKKDTEESVLLHEFAHAVHDQLLGFEHQGIKAAYQQAMERKLYDKDLYVATNHKEFFAELSCAYLDRLYYFPHNRADLQKHDPVTFKTMETLWAGAAKKPDVAKKDAGPGNGSDRFDLALALPADVKFGTAVVGTVPAARETEGKVVVIGYWGGEFATVLNRLNAWHEELAPFGFLAVGSCVLKDEPAALAAEAAKRGSGFPVLDRVFVKDADGDKYRTQPAGHTLVFDHTGKCVYRGSAYEADKAVRAAVGRKLVAEACRGAEPPAALKQAVAAFAAGTDPVAVLPKITPYTSATDEEVKAVAKHLADAILAPGQRALAEAQANAKTDPVAAFVAGEAVAARYKGTSLATKAQTMTTNLKQDKAVALELKARGVLTQLQKGETHLRGQNGSFNPTDPKFQVAHQQVLAQMQTVLDQLRKQYPNTRATAEAEKIAREFGLKGSRSADRDK